MIDKKKVFIFAIFLLGVGGVSLRMVFPSLKAERAKLYEKSKAVDLGYYLPPFNALADVIQNDKPFETLDSKKFMSFYKRAIKVYPDLTDTHSLLGFFYYHNEELDKSIESYQKAASFNAHFFWNHYNLAVLHYKKGNHEASVKSIQEALSKKPEVSLMIINRSGIYRQIWKYFNNTEKFLTLSLRQGFEDVLALRMLNAFKQGRYAESLNIATNAIKSDFKRLTFFHHYAGASAYHLDQFEPALYFLQKCVESNRDDKEALYYLGLTMNAMGQKEMAEQILQRVVYLNQANAGPLREEEISLRIF